MRKKSQNHIHKIYFEIGFDKRKVASGKFVVNPTLNIIVKGNEPVNVTSVSIL